ncbi:MAG: type II toxin-antitoxin system VapC family toxin [Sulfuricaulis sp.]|nr:type II toxin-antitoxin system VapC family toxin [Sulfuricaulis sp.]
MLDSSVALAWLLQDEANGRTDALADRIEQENAHVPPIWFLEVGNAQTVVLPQSVRPALSHGSQGMAVTGGRSCRPSQSK